MRMILEGETRIHLDMKGDGFEIISEEHSLSPYHLLAGSLASCIALVARPWSEETDVPLAPLTISVNWELAEDQVRTIDVELRWPGLPETRRDAVRRIAEACPVHGTLESGTQLSTRVE